MSQAILMIVEDEIFIAKEIEEILISLDYPAPVFALSGEEAIEKVGKEQPDLVLMDIKLKAGMDGIEAAQIIQNRLQIPIVYLTSYADEDTIERAKLTEPYGYLLKPFQAKELHTAIEMALYKHNMGKRLRESEKLFRSLFEQSNDAIVIHDMKGKILDINSRACEMLGYDYEKLKKSNLSKLHHNTELITPKKTFQEINKKGHIRFESKLKKADSTIVCVEISTRVIDEEQKIAQSIIRDITENKEAEKKIRQEKETLALLNDLNHAANRGDSLHEIIDLFNCWARDFFSVNGTTVYLLSPDKEHLILQNSTLPPDLMQRIEKLIGMKIPRVRIRLNAGGLYAEMLRSGKSRIIDDPAVIQQMMVECTENNALQKLVPAISRILKCGYVMSVPLIGDGEAIGLVDLSRQESFSESDLERFTVIAEQFTTILRRKRAEEALKSSVEKYKKIVEMAPDGIVILDLNGVLQACNPAMSEMTGYPEEELVGKHFTELRGLRKEDKPRYNKFFRSLSKRGDNIKDFAFIWVNKEGEVRNGEAHISAMKEDGKITGFQIIMRDVTEREKSEELRRRHAQLFEMLVKNNPDVIARLDSELRHLYVNPAVESVIGIPPSEFIGKTYRELIGNSKKILEKYPASFQVGPKNLKKLNKDIIHVFEKGVGLTEEYEFRTPEGTRWYLSNIVPEIDKNGIVESVLHISRDITEQKKAEEEILRYNEFLNNIMKSLTHPFYVIDTNDYTIKMSNPALNVGDFSGNPTCYQCTHDKNEPCTGEDCICPIEEIKKTRKAVVVDHVHRESDGTTKYVEIHAYPIFDDQGNVVQMIEYSLDVTQRKQAEDEKRILEERLRRSQRMETIGRLAGGIAHDFNNILAPMVVYLDMALDDIPQDNRARADLEHVIKGVERAKALVQQILIFSRQNKHERHPVQIHIVVKEALQLIRASVPSHIEIHQYIDDSCGTIMADPTQIHQIIMNLCTNAYYTMQSTGGILTVELQRVKIADDMVKLYPRLHKGNYVKLSVSDTGFGMDRSVLNRIFEPFFTTKEIGEGAGLGLSVVHGIVLSQDGEITVESEPGKGTTFTIYLPLVEVCTIENDQQTTDMVGGDERILFIDDDEENAIMGREMLERIGYQVTVKEDGREALEVFRTQPEEFDLVITDQNMPKMTGTRLAEEMIKIRADIPIILISGFSGMGDTENIKKIGIRELIMKPILRHEMCNTIRNVLDKVPAEV